MKLSKKKVWIGIGLKEYIKLLNKSGGRDRIFEYARKIYQS